MFQTYSAKRKKYNCVRTYKAKLYNFPILKTLVIGPLRLSLFFRVHQYITIKIRAVHASVRGCVCYHPHSPV